MCIKISLVQLCSSLLFRHDLCGLKETEMLEHLVKAREQGEAGPDGESARARREAAGASRKGLEVYTRFSSDREEGCREWIRFLPIERLSILPPTA